MTCVSENACSDDHTPPVRRKLLLCHATSFILLCLCVWVWRSASPAPDMRSIFFDSHILITASGYVYPYSVSYFSYPFLNSYPKKLLA